MKVILQDYEKVEKIIKVKHAICVTSGTISIFSTQIFKHG